MTPAETWKDLFQKAEKSSDPEEHAIAEEMQHTDALFVPSSVPSAEEILRLLRENDPDTITIVAIGPLTNLALAASLNPETFLKVKEVVVMGGSVNEGGNVGPSTTFSTPNSTIKEPPFRLIEQAPGPIRNMLNLRNQITPVAEFNTFADAVAAARVYALSSPNPRSTMPPTAPSPPGTQADHPPPTSLQPYPSNLSRQLKVTLFPLDITHRHTITRGEFRKTLEPLLAQKSPLAEWVSAFMTSTFDKVESLQRDVSGDDVGLELHDPLCIWYCMALDPSQWKLVEDEDLRVETSGQWTRGMCVVDRRTRKKREDDDEGERPGDTGNWLSMKNGNRLRRCVGSPGKDLFGGFLLKRIFGL